MKWNRPFASVRVVMIGWGGSSISGPFGEYGRAYSPIRTPAAGVTSVVIAELWRT